MFNNKFEKIKIFWMVFINLFCVLLKKMKMRWNEKKWINERNGNELKKKNKGNQIGLKLLSGVWVVGHLWLGGFRNKRKGKELKMGRRKRKREVAEGEGQWARAGKKKFPPFFGWPFGQPNELCFAWNFEEEFYSTWETFLWCLILFSIV